MRKLLLISGILTIFFITCIIWFSVIMVNKVDSTIKHKKALIGNRYVINRDTVFVVDQSILRDVYILDNGKEIGTALIDKLTPLK